ncbi:Uncharacterized protein PBTT_04779 [Plasmodiophora brassicae]
MLDEDEGEEYDDDGENFDDEEDEDYADDEEDDGPEFMALDDEDEDEDEEEIDEAPFVTLQVDEPSMPATMSNMNSPSGHGGIQKVDPNAPQAPTLAPTFSSFDNAKPQNDGLCLEALNQVWACSVR